MSLPLRDRNVNSQYCELVAPEFAAMFVVGRQPTPNVQSGNHCSWQLKPEI